MNDQHNVFKSLKMRCGHGRQVRDNIATKRNSELLKLYIRYLQLLIEIYTGFGVWRSILTFSGKTGYIVKKYAIQGAKGGKDTWLRIRNLKNSSSLFI
jgi:hypothetical protein